MRDIIKKLCEIAIHVGLSDCEPTIDNIIVVLKEAECQKCKELANELSVLKSKMEEVTDEIYDIDCSGNVMIQLSVKDGIPTILQAMNGGGEPLKVSSIIISKAHRDGKIKHKENPNLNPNGYHHETGRNED